MLSVKPDLRDYVFDHMLLKWDRYNDFPMLLEALIDRPPVFPAAYMQI